MIEPSFIDDIDTDFCGDFFNHIDDLLDFPTEDVEIEGGIGSECCNGSFQDIAWQPPPEPDTFVSNSGNKSTAGTSELPTELSVSDEDIAQLEWLSNFVEDSFSAGSITLEKEDESSDKKKDFHHFHSSSPVSVLETSSSYPGEKTIFRGRPRSKRPRPASFHPPAVPFILPTSPEFENFTESYPKKKIVKFVVKEDKKKKSLSLPIGVMDERKLALTEPIVVRKCMHCEITKTPQWRAGPMGPKTLCNACGVRYKSGRLFPEYRPAASPTFVESLHSCSHKKVLEMRKTLMDETTLITVPISEFSA